MAARMGTQTQQPPGQPPARRRAVRVSARDVVRQLVKYLTNSVVQHTPSYTVRHWWDLHPTASILMGQQVQFAGLRTSGSRVSIGEGAVINRGCLLYTTGGLRIG